VPEVCTIHCATANPVDVPVAETELGRGVLEEEAVLGDLVPADVLGPEEEIHIGLRSEAIDAAVARLPERHARILRLRYGMDDDQPHPVTAVAKQLGISWTTVPKLEGPRRARRGTRT